MSSCGVSKYRQSVKTLIDNAINYPRLHYRNLDDFRTFLTGYFSAYSLLEKIDDENSFNTCFNNWLCHKTNSSGSSGWEAVINELAKEKDADPEQLFFDYVQEFLDQWGKEVT